jgi:O-phosphoseryl-tRNA(Cys) synthetase
MPPHNPVTFNKYPKGTYPTVRFNKSIGKEHPLAYELAQLRHAYMHLIAERVTNQKTSVRRASSATLLLS